MVTPSLKVSPITISKEVAAFKTWVDLDGIPWIKSEIIRRVVSKGMFSKTVDIFEDGNKIWIS